MVSFKAIAAAAASILSLASAAPVEARINSLSHGFKINQVANPNFVGRHGPAHYAKAQSKYGFKTDSIVSLVAAGSAGITPTSVTASPVGGTAIQEYLCDVTIGGQSFQLDFDTGSSDLWVAGAGIPGASQIYAPTSTPVPGASWEIQYGDGSSASGDVYLDTVVIAGASVAGQSVERAQVTNGNFFTGNNDGLLGLAFSSDNTVTPQPAKTWFDNAVAQGLPAVFAANLAASGPGSYDFGMVDDSAYTGTLAYTNVDSSTGRWLFTPDSGEQGIVDTGTTLILLSEAGVSDYYAKLEGATFDNVNQNGWIYPCANTPPDFSITVGGYTAVVPGADINFQTLDSGMCFGGIQLANGIPFAIYGDVFLKSQYVAFDQRSGAPQLGFAAKA